MTTLVTGAGLIGTEFARCALARGEAVVFVDPEPREDFLRMKLGEALEKRGVAPHIFESAAEAQSDFHKLEKDASE